MPKSETSISVTRVAYVFVTLLLMNLSVWAEPSLNSTKPPTVQQTIDSYKGKKFPSSIPFPNSLAYGNTTDTNGMIHMIASLEKAFPGAIWAPLGRDAHIGGDVLDAFYTILFKDPNRVSPLRASTATLTNSSSSSIVQFLKSAGADFNPKNNKAKPFIILDRTSFNPGSQSTRILQAAFDEWEKNGGTPERFLTRFNVVDISGGDGMSDPGEPKFQPERFLQNQASRLRGSKNVASIDIMRLDGFTDGAAWHDTYGNFKNNNDGYYGSVGNLLDISSRQRLLNNQWEIIQEVKSNKFLTAVKNKGKQLRGYVVGDPINRRAPRKLTQKDLKEIGWDKLHSIADGNESINDGEHEVRSILQDTKLLSDFVGNRLNRKQLNTLKSLAFDNAEMAEALVSILEQDGRKRNNKTEMKNLKKLLQYFIIHANERVQNGFYQGISDYIQKNMRKVLKDPEMLIWLETFLVNRSLDTYAIDLADRYLETNPNNLDTKSGREFFVKVAKHLPVIFGDNKFYLNQRRLLKHPLILPLSKIEKVETGRSFDQKALTWGPVFVKQPVLEGRKLKKISRDETTASRFIAGKSIDDFSCSAKLALVR